MNYKPGDTIYGEFVTSRFDTGAATNADSLPTATLNRNGTDDATSVTVTNLDAGRYKFSVTVPATWNVGDVLNISIAATVNSVAGKGVVWSTKLGVGTLSTGTATAGGASTITLATAIGADTLPVGTYIAIVAGTGAGQLRRISAYVNSTKVATVDLAWTTNPDSTSVYAILWAGTTISTTQAGNLDAAVSSRSTYAGGDTSGTTTLLGRLTSGRATNLDNLDAAVSSRGTGDATVANQTTINNNVLTRLATSNYTAPDNTNIGVAATQASAANTKAGAIQTILTGITSLAAWIRALIRSSTADATALSEINTGGGTWSATTASLQAIAAAGGGGGGGDPLTNLLGSYASGTAGGALQLLTVSPIEVNSPVTETNVLTLTQGDSYQAADNRALDFTLPAATWGDLTSATVAFCAIRGTSQIGPVTGSITSPNTPSQTAQIQLDPSDTSAATPTDNPGDYYKYAVRVTDAGGHVITTFKGQMRLDRNLFA